MRSSLATALVLVALFPTTAARAVDVADVDPLIGTGSHEPNIQRGGGAGATVPGAAVPFGLVQMSPETAPALNAFGAGYAYDDTRSTRSARRLRGMALFDATPQGLPGNDDAGALSAWYVFAALRRYPLWPGSAALVAR